MENQLNIVFIILFREESYNNIGYFNFKYGIMSNSFNHNDLKSNFLNVEISLNLGLFPRTPTKCIKSSDIVDIQNSENIVNSILQDRSARSQKYASNPYNMGSSPLSSKDGSLSKIKNKQKTQKTQRMEERERKLLENRGGLNKMEEFVMKGERKRELDDLARLALEYAIPEDIVDTFEEECRSEDNVEPFHKNRYRLMFQDQGNQPPLKKEKSCDNDDDGSDDDNDLIRYFENKERYEGELEQLLSELSMT